MTVNKYLLLLLTVFYFPNIGFCNDLTEAKLDSALFYMYNFQLERSNEIFNNLSREKPPHPLAPLGSLVTQWEMNQYTLGFREGNKALLDSLNEALRVYKEMISDGASPVELLFYGATRGLKSRILLAEKDWIGVMINGYKAIQYIKEAHKQAPQLWDVYLPIGVYEYYMGISSGLMQFVSKIFIMDADREGGLEHLQIAAEKGHYGKREAMGILAFVLLYMEEDYDKSLKYSEELDRELPLNPYYAFLACETRLLKGDIEIADRHLHKIYSVTKNYHNFQKEEWEQKIALLEGTRAFVVHDLDQAEKILTKLINDYSMEFDWHLSYAYLRLGKTYDLQGKRTKAREMYQHVLDLDNRTSAAKWARIYLQTPFIGN